MSDLLLRFVIITLCISAITASILAGIGWHHGRAFLFGAGTQWQFCPAPIDSLYHSTNGFEWRAGATA